MRRQICGLTYTKQVISESNPIQVGDIIDYTGIAQVLETSVKGGQFVVGKDHIGLYYEVGAPFEEDQQRQTKYIKASYKHYISRPSYGDSFSVWREITKAKPTEFERRAIAKILGGSGSLFYETVSVPYTIMFENSLEGIFNYILSQDKWRKFTDCTLNIRTGNVWSTKKHEAGYYSEFEITADASYVVEKFDVDYLLPDEEEND